MSSVLRFTTVCIAVLALSVLTPPMASAQRTQSTSADATVSRLKAGGNTATEIARILQRDYRLTRSQAEQLLRNAGFDTRTVNAALQTVYGSTTSPTTTTRTTTETATGTATRGTSPTTRTTATLRGTSGGATISGGPTRAGPAPPQLSVQLLNAQGGTATVQLASGDAPTAMRFANSLAELTTATWEPYSPTASFAMNGQFPAQVVVQVGKPVGMAAHPVNGPHAESDPQVIRDDALMRNDGHLTLRWESSIGPWTDAPGDLVARVEGLGNAGPVGLENIRWCSGLRELEGFGAPQPRVTRVDPGTLEIRAHGEFRSGEVSGCEVSFTALGEGGNFDPGVEYSYRRSADLPNPIRRMPSHRTGETAAFLYRPRFSYSGPAGPIQPGAPGDCRHEIRNGKLVIEATSGPLPLLCAVWSEEVLLPQGMEVTALHWRVVEYPAGESGRFHCKVGPFTRATPGVHFEGGRGRESVAPGKTAYFHTTYDANPLLPDGIAPDVDADLSTPMKRHWILPLQATLSCDPREGLDDGLIGDRIRLILNSIEYTAPPGLPVGD